MKNFLKNSSAKSLIFFILNGLFSFKFSMHTTTKGSNNEQQTSNIQRGEMQNLLSNALETENKVLKKQNQTILFVLSIILIIILIITGTNTFLIYNIYKKQNSNKEQITETSNKEI